MKKIEYVTLVINQYLSYTIKLCFTGNKWQSLCLILKKWGNLRKNWNLASIKLVVNILIRFNKVEKLIQLIANNKKPWDVVKTIYFQYIFLFIYDIWGLANVNSNYSNSWHDVNNFKLGVTVAIKFQILSQNLKTSKRVNAIKGYLFWLLRVYLVDNPMHSTMLTTEKRWHKDNK